MGIQVLVLIVRGTAYVNCIQSSVGYVFLDFVGLEHVV